MVIGECERGRSPSMAPWPTFSSTARIRADMACICTFSDSMVRSKLVHHAKRKSSFSSLVIAAHCLPAAGAAIAASRLLPAAGPPAVTRQTAIPDRAKAVTLICRETVEQPHAAGAFKPILAAVARWVRRIPRPTTRVVCGAGAVAVPEHGSADSTRSPILAGHVVTRWKRFAV